MYCLIFFTIHTIGEQTIRGEIRDFRILKRALPVVPPDTRVQYIEMKRIVSRAMNTVVRNGA